MYYKRLKLFILVVGLSTSCLAQKINGLSFVSSRDTISLYHVKPVINVNANYVALMPFGFIRDLESPEIRFDSDRQWFGERDRGIRQYASEFKKEAIKVMLKPQIWVWKGEFTGNIKMDSEENWEKLEESYERFILTYANTAKAIGADMFCIGTELEQFVVNRPDFWKQLIKKIRRIYKGKLTYAANWDEFKRVPFWKELDYIGVDAYFPLTELKSPSIEDFEKGWEEHKKVIQSLSENFGKPVLFTEFGYRSVDFTGREPWDSEHFGEVNLKAQADALQAIYNQFWNEDWFAGGFIWKWFHRHNRVGGKENNRFTPQNKPAEKVLQKLYAQ